MQKYENAYVQEIKKLTAKFTKCYAKSAKLMYEHTPLRTLRILRGLCG